MVKSLILIIIPVFCISAAGRLQVENKDSLPVEIYAVTVTPHHVSGEIPGYDRDEKFTATYNPGALVKIFVSNRSVTDTIIPSVTFNGKTGRELLDSGIVSYCNSPDVRISSTQLSVKIPPSSSDFYLLNVTDSNFYANGIRLEITDKVTGKALRQTVTIRRPKLITERIIFTSSDSSKYPDGFNIFFRNNSGEKAVIAGIKVFRAGKDFREHWWKTADEPDRIGWFGENGTVQPGEMNGASVKTGKLPFGEILVEIDYRTGREKQKSIFNIKPLIIDFAFGMGWAERDLAGSELFCKTMSLLYLNTVNGNAQAFFAQKERTERYDVKKFAKLQDVEQQNRPENLSRIHAAEHFGEPQFSKRPAQEIYDYYTAYRNSGYPTTLTLSHEPGFNRYAGVVDFPHFDAYRVTAPHADRWGAYEKYGEKNVRWGAPLETIGDYMRSLHRISAPYPSAAWTQGMSSDWSHRLRPGAGNPNELEMRIQAIEAVANGALSLYWFNISGKNVIRSRQSLAEIQRINREIKVAEDFIAGTVPYSWEQKFNDLDLNVLAGSTYAVLAAIDLKYAVSPQNQFVTSGERIGSLEFRVPPYLSGCDAAVRITSAGVSQVAPERKGEFFVINDRFMTTAIYILYSSKSQNIFEILKARYEECISNEKKLGFDPIVNDDDFRRLCDELNIIEKKEKK